MDRITAAIDKVTVDGGKIAKPAYEEGDLLVAPVRGPSGNLIGLWQDRAR